MVDPASGPFLFDTSAESWLALSQDAAVRKWLRAYLAQHQVQVSSITVLERVRGGDRGAGSRAAKPAAAYAPACRVQTRTPGPLAIGRHHRIDRAGRGHASHPQQPRRLRGHPRSDRELTAAFSRPRATQACRLRATRLSVSPHQLTRRTPPTRSKCLSRLRTGREC